MLIVWENKSALDKNSWNKHSAHNLHHWVREISAKFPMNKNHNNKKKLFSMLIVSSRQQWDNEIKLREENEMFAEIYIKTERFQTMLYGLLD